MSDGSGTLEQARLLSQAPPSSLRRSGGAYKAKSFGVLTEIDVRQTIREKLGAEMEPCDWLEHTLALIR